MESVVITMEVNGVRVATVKRNGVEQAKQTFDSVYAGKFNPKR